MSTRPRTSAATNDLTIYQSVFDNLKLALASDTIWLNGILEAKMSGSTIKDFSYMLKDMDGNGIQELFLYDGGSKLLIAVFTIANNKVELLQEFWSKNSGYLTVNDQILTDWTNGTDNSRVSVFSFANMVTATFLIQVDGYEVRTDEKGTVSYIKFDYTGENEDILMNSAELDTFNKNPNYMENKNLHLLQIP
ncbi:MAG: hypothetical protein LBR22_03665 [Desulfovibrio sp.]|nr:hypothetical protein [Desulfovibrio sp.]